MDNQDNAPLRAGSEEALTTRVMQRQTGSNSHAVKVAGLTVLVCLLLSSQALMAYMVFSHGGQIQALQKSTEKMIKLASRPPVAPVQMHLPMNTMPRMMDFSEEEAPKKANTPLVKLEQTAKAAPGATAESVTTLKTKCNLESAGKSSLGSYKPQCDEQGNYLPMQCWHATGYCWCVDGEGLEIPGTLVRGRPSCGAGIDARAPVLLRAAAPSSRMAEIKPLSTDA